MQLKYQNMFLEENNIPWLQLSACFTRYFLLILLYALLFEAQKFQWNILMQRSLFEKVKWILIVYMRKSQRIRIPFILVSEIVVWLVKQWTSIVDVLSFADKNTLSFSLFVSFFSFSLRFPTLALFRSLKTYQKLKCPCDKKYFFFLWI